MADIGPIEYFEQTNDAGVFWRVAKFGPWELLGPDGWAPRLPTEEAMSHLEALDGPPPEP